MYYTSGCLILNGGMSVGLKNKIEAIGFIVDEDNFVNIPEGVFKGTAKELFIKIVQLIRTVLKKSNVIGEIVICDDLEFDKHIFKVVNGKGLIWLRNSDKYDEIDRILF